MYLRESIRKILNEEISSQVRRRIPTFEETFKHYRKAFIDYKIRNFEAYWNLIMETVSETLYHAWFINTVPDDDWEESEKYIQDYLTKNYHNETEKMWEKKHRKRLNESKTINYPKLINDILSSYKEEDFICDIDVSYYNEVYEVAVKIDKKEFEKKYEKEDINYATILMTGYLDRIKRNIIRDIKTLLPVDVFVWFRQINCDKKINESEDKNQSLLLLLNQYGLYEFMKMTGLSLPQIISKTGEPPREVLEGYIMDFMTNDAVSIPGSDGDIGFVFPVPLSTNKEAESFYLSKGVVTVEINEYGEYGMKTSGSYERLVNLSDDEIYKIVKEMINWGEDTYYEL
jgi:hypothetical protein